jgi:hypothetical protein
MKLDSGVSSSMSSQLPMQNLGRTIAKKVRNTFGPSLHAELDAIKQSGHVLFFPAPAANAFGNCYAAFGTEL